MFNHNLKNSLKTLRILHKILGYAVVILGKVVATLIVSQKVSDILFRAWVFVLVGILLFFLMLEVVYRS